MVPPGVPGDITARGSNIMMGDWKSPAATAEAMRNGYYHTGDLGHPKWVQFCDSLPKNQSGKTPKAALREAGIQQHKTIATSRTR